ncbi:hypothetical protein NXY39_20770 [Bacteroides fragilis]|nr:hypothetical protein [Bacteroides fragilis]
MEKEEEITGRSEAGEITVYAKIGKQEITFCYVENAAEADGTPTGNHPFTRSEVGEAGRAQNKEIAVEKTAEDTKTGR